ncbi:MAG TPA: hypothetical protein VKR22_08125 [Acidimicrobiales bacterium]|nr:hypothetical protein [Acidimicrobiales bacterium]
MHLQHLPAEAGAVHHASHPTGPGSVVLDIGATTGALVVYAPVHTVGDEIEIRRVGREWQGDHVAVRRRQVGSRSFAAALFGPLEAGSYQLRWRNCGYGPDPLVELRPGVVSETTLGTTRADGPGLQENGDPEGRRAPY